MSQFQQMQDRWRRQTGGAYVVELAKRGGTYKAGNGYVYARKIGKATNTGASVTNPIQKFRYSKRGVFVWGVGRQFWVQAGFDGIDELVQHVDSDFEAAGLSVAQLNVAERARQYYLAESMVNLNSFAQGTAEVSILPTVYRMPNGKYGAYAGTTSEDLLTGYAPADSDDQVIVCEWLNPYTRTVTLTASHAVPQTVDLKADSLANAMPLINECEDSAPGGNIGVWAWIVRGDDTIIAESNKLCDLRGIIGSGIRPTHTEAVIYDGELVFYNGDIVMIEVA